jgi:cystathionine gamma-synthase
LVDLAKVTELCRPKRIRVLIDATFATPINMRPLEHGVDLVMHSATKYIAGHNDVLAGVVAGQAGLVSLIRDARHVLGGVCDPHAAYLVHRGMKTMALRVVHQNRTALALAQALEGQKGIRRVWYPGLASHPNHDTATRYLSGFGGVVTFEIDGDLKSTGQFVDRLAIPRIAPSLGGVESLVEQVALMSYFELTTEQRHAVGISDSLVRYSVGLEDPAEIIADVLQALAER